MQGIARALLVGAAVWLVAAEASAQGVIRGTLVDSLRGGAPVANADVALLGLGRRVRSDAAGRFEFRDVPAGDHEVAVHGPWLDSLALPPLRQRVRVDSPGPAARVALATPARSEYARARCGFELDETQGILHGEVSDAEGRPLDGVLVSARWTETHLGAQQLDRFVVGTADTSTASGMFQLCGVPPDAAVTVVAGDSSRRTDELLVEMSGTFVRRRDLRLGGPDDRVRVVGRVLGPDGGALQGAIVQIAGDSARLVLTDASGRFALSALPVRSTQLRVRAVGHEPTLLDLDPHAGDVEIPDVAMRRAARELSRVTVTSEVMARRRLEFDQRRMYNPGGRFIPDEELAKLPVITATAVAAMVHRSRAVGNSIMLEFNGEFCHPLIFVDGMRIGRLPWKHEKGNLDAYEVARWLQLAKRIEMYRAAFAPAQYVDFAGCGAILIWTE